MSGMISSSISSPTSISLSQHQMKTINSLTASSSLAFPSISHHQTSLWSSKNLKIKCPQIQGEGVGRLSIKCSSSTGPGGPGSGETDSKSVLNAFFLGKALAEAINERIESTVGELLSTIGRVQAEQQKQVQDFQEDVLERAKRAKEKAAREAMEGQSLITKSTTARTSAANDVVSPVVMTPNLRPNSNNTSTSRFKDPLLGMFDDE